MKKIFDYVDQNFDRMMEEMKEFCSYRSVAGDKTGLEETRNWIDKKLSAVGIPHEFQKVENGNALISASVSGKDGDKHPSLLFYNHYDVVEEGKHELWSNEPFGPVTRDGVLYGRGVSDNKGPLLSRIQAVEAILAVEGKLPINVKFLFEGDEETSSPS